MTRGTSRNDRLSRIRSSPESVIAPAPLRMRTGDPLSRSKTSKEQWTCCVRACWHTLRNSPPGGTRSAARGKARTQKHPTVDVSLSIRGRKDRLRLQLMGRTGGGRDQIRLGAIVPSTNRCRGRPLLDEDVEPAPASGDGERIELGLCDPGERVAVDVAEQLVAAGYLQDPFFFV